MADFKVKSTHPSNLNHGQKTDTEAGEEQRQGTVGEGCAPESREGLSKIMAKTLQNTVKDIHLLTLTH